MFFVFFKGSIGSIHFGWINWGYGIPPFIEKSPVFNGKSPVLTLKMPFFFENDHQFDQWKITQKVIIPYFSHYPLVNVYITMEHHHSSWINQLFQWQFSRSQTVRSLGHIWCSRANSTDLSPGLKPYGFDLWIQSPWGQLTLMVKHVESSRPRGRSPTETLGANYDVTLHWLVKSS